VCFYLDEDGEEALFDPFSQELYYVSHDVGIRISPHRGGLALSYPFLRGG